MRYIKKSGIFTRTLGSKCIPFRARPLLAEKGNQCSEGIEHEGISTDELRKSNIVNVIKYPSTEFCQLH